MPDTEDSLGKRSHRHSTARLCYAKELYCQEVQWNRIEKHEKRVAIICIGDELIGKGIALYCIGIAETSNVVAMHCKETGCGGKE